MNSFPPQNLTQDWPLPSIELNIHPQDFLSCSGLLCSSSLNEMQRGPENSPFIIAINKGSVLWEFGGLRLLETEISGDCPQTAHSTTGVLLQKLTSLEVFESVSSY